MSSSRNLVVLKKLFEVREIGSHRGQGFQTFHYQLVSLNTCVQRRQRNDDRWWIVWLWAAREAVDRPAMGGKGGGCSSGYGKGELGGVLVVSSSGYGGTDQNGSKKKQKD